MKMHLSKKMRLNSSSRRKGWKHEWCLLTDNLKVNLRVVLLQNGNIFPSVSLAHTVYMKKTWKYEISVAKNDVDHLKWKIYGDQKVVLLLLGTQLG